MTSRAILLAMLAATTGAGAAAAADYGPVYGGMLAAAPEIRPVEIGTGWYLRGDVGYEFERDFDGSANFSNAFGQADEPFRTLSLDSGFTGGAGVGYRFSEYLRGDLTARYGRHDLAGSIGTPAFFCGGVSCETGLSGEARTWELMANAYVDLGTFAGFTPYVGGGVGAVNVDFSKVAGSFCTTTAAGSTDCEAPSIEGGDSWRFAYNVGAGLAYNVNRSLTLDVGYRYLNVDGGSLGVSTLGDTTTTGEDDGYDRHTITAGVRYALW